MKQFFESVTIRNKKKKLGEFYEEIKRLNINILRPDINKSFEDFRSDDKAFYYALGAIKNVGYEAVSNIVKEREKNGKFESIEDFISRVNPKDINKLQLEGLVKAGSFDGLLSNRASIYESIPSLITNSKNIYENKNMNQSNLFEDTDNLQINKVVKIKADWKFEDRLSKEFESIGFFISDHPLNQFKDLFEQYNIINFNKFDDDNAIKQSNVAATILKIQERKTNKGTPYAIIKFSDLSGVFELFIFSEILNLNRDFIKEGVSCLLMLNKSFSDDEKKVKKINIQKILSIKEIYDKPIRKIKFVLDSTSNVDNLSDLINEPGNTDVKISINNNDKEMIFRLKNKRNINQKIIESLKKLQIRAEIS